MPNNSVVSFVQQQSCHKADETIVEPPIRMEKASIAENVNIDCKLEYSSHGLMFGLVSNENIRVTGISIRPGTTRSCSYSVYYRKGGIGLPAQPIDELQWTKAGTTGPLSAQCCELTKLESKLDIYIPKGETYGIYIHSTEHKTALGYVHEGTESLGHIFHSGRHLSVCEGVYTAAPQPFLSIDQHPRQFTGVIYYEVCSPAVVPGAAYTEKSGSKEKKGLIKKWGSEGSNDGQFLQPKGVAVNPATGHIIVSDHGNHRVQVFNPDGTFAFKFGAKGDDAGEFMFPTGIAVNRQGTQIIVADYNHRVQVFSASSGQFLFQFGECGMDDGEFMGPNGVAVNQNNDILVVDSQNHRVQIFNQNGQFLSAFGDYGYGKGQMANPISIAVNRSGQILVGDYDGGKINVFDRSGCFIREMRVVDGFMSLYVAVDQQDNIVVLDFAGCCVRTLREDGQMVHKFGSEGLSDGQFMSPQAIAITPANQVVVVDAAECCVQLFDRQ